MITHPEGFVNRKYDILSKNIPKILWSINIYLVHIIYCSLKKGGDFIFIKSVKVKNIYFITAVILLIFAIGFFIFTFVTAYREYIRETLAQAEEKIVYLTFDDGPSVVTEKILDILKEENVPATFFVTGATTERGKLLYKRMKDEGHSIGIHSYSHKYSEIYINSDAFLKDFTRLEGHLKEIVGETPKIFRFPGGSTNSTVSPSVIKEIKQKISEKGYIYFDWNALAKDDLHTPTLSEDIFLNVVKSGGDKKRILVLMHDDTIRTTAPEALRKIIEYYREKGYRFEALTENTKPIQFK